MDHNIMIQIVMSIIYFASVLYMDTRYTKCCNDINDELREARNIIQDLEDQIVKRDDQIEGHKFFVETAEKRETELEQQLVDRNDIIRNLETIIGDRQNELEALNKKVASIAISATNLVEEAETPHLIEA